MKRIPVTPFVRNLFSNVPIEAGVTDSQVVSTNLSFDAKTFGRYRIEPPAAVDPRYLPAVGRLTLAPLGFDAAHVIATVRRGPCEVTQHLHTAIMAQAVKSNQKGSSYFGGWIDRIVKSARRVCLFDRADCIGYLRPIGDDAQGPQDAPESLDWLVNIRLSADRLRYLRLPRIFASITVGSLQQRVRTYGDEAVERLAEVIQDGHGSLTVINDSPSLAHRVFRGIFVDAAAVAIIDGVVAVVRPIHGRCIRIYDALKTSEHRPIIRSAIRDFASMRRFRAHRLSVAGTLDFLNRRLSFPL